MSFHNSQIRNHIPHNWTFADSTAREDTTDPNSGLGYASADLYKLARQTDDDSLWMLTAVTPTWQVVSGGSSTATVPTAVEGNVLIGDSTPEWVLLDASADTKVLVGNGTTLTSQALSGDVTMTNAGVVTIADDAVALAKLASITRGSLIVGEASDAPTLLSGKTLGAILIGDGTDITSTVNPSIAGNVTVGGTLTVNTTNLVVNSTGVGIGTTNPQATIHTVGDSIILFDQTNSNMANVALYNSGSEAAGGTISGALYFMSDDDAGNRNGYAIITGLATDRTNGAEEGALAFNTQTAGTRTEKMRITSSGNVLIGTTTDDGSNKLQVNGSTYISGNVGIGTTNPQAPMHTVVGTAGVLFEQTNGNTYINVALYNSGVTGSDRSGALYFQAKNDAGNKNSYALISGLATDRTNGAEEGAIVFYTQTAGTRTEKMRITSSGNIGIGTGSPNEKLTVAGALSITDGMTAPSQTSGYAKIYVDTDGDLKIKFGDGEVKTIVTDS
jgi:hypothetical protein